MKHLIFLSAIVFLFTTCKKGPGEGGRAFIKGKVFVKNFTAPPCPCSLQDEYYAQDENVFIMFGDEPGVGESVKTAYDGSFQFQYLRKGKYKVYALSDDTSSTINSKTVAIPIDVEIKKSNETVNLPDIVIVK